MSKARKDCRVSLETQTLAEQSDSCKSEARLAPNFAYSSDGVDDSVDTRGVEDPAHPPWEAAAADDDDGGARSRHRPPQLFFPDYHAQAGAMVGTCICTIQTSRWDEL